MINHPVFEALRGIVNNKYRVFFVNKPEMDNWLFAKAYKTTDEFMSEEDGYYEYILRGKSTYGQPVKIFVSHELFDEEGNLKNLKQGQWNSSFVKCYTPKAPPKENKDDDEIPF